MVVRKELCGSKASKKWRDCLNCWNPSFQEIMEKRKPTLLGKRYDISTVTYCVKLAYLAARKVVWQQLGVVKVFQLGEYCNGAMGSGTGGFFG